MSIDGHFPNLLQCPQNNGSKLRLSMRSYFLLYLISSLDFKPSFVPILTQIQEVSILFPKIIFHFIDSLRRVLDLHRQLILSSFTILKLSFLQIWNSFMSFFNISFYSCRVTVLDKCFRWLRRKKFHSQWNTTIFSV